MNNVAIIGTGPTGILAGWAAALEGAGSLTFFYPPGTDPRSTIYGAQYIHGNIPETPTHIEPFWVRYRRFGTEEGYRRNIYGNKVPPGGTSWSAFGVKELAWPMSDIYYYFGDWMMMNAKFVELNVNADRCAELVEDFDWVFNTAPLNKIQPVGDYRFEAVNIANDANVYSVPRDEIWYFGDGRAAYRASNIMGHQSTEFPARMGQVPELPWNIRRKLVKILKPLSCSGVELPGVYRLGRYGKWQKGVLTHHAFEEVRHVMSKGLPWSATLPDLLQGTSLWRNELTIPTSSEDAQ